MLTLKPVIHNADCRPWCGIVALSALSGNPTEHSRQFFREILTDNESVTGKHRVLKGLFTSEIVQALKGMCFDIKEIKSPATYSIARFLHFWKPETGKLALIFIKGHVLVASDKEIVDSSYLSPIPFWRYTSLDAEVTRCFEISDTSLGDL